MTNTKKKKKSSHLSGKFKRPDTPKPRGMKSHPTYVQSTVF